MNGRGSFSFKKRLRIYLRDAFTCRYCDRAMNPLSDDLSLDHIDPIGGDDDSNLVTSCISCNSRKGSRTPEAWRAAGIHSQRVEEMLKPGEILEQVVRARGLKVAALRSPARTTFLVEARAEAAWRLRAECGLSLKQIGSLLGGRDHSTIIHLLKKGPPGYPHVDANSQHGVGENVGGLAGPDPSPPDLEPSLPTSPPFSTAASR